MTVHVVGNLCFDTTLAVARFPVPGETLVARDSWTGLGGKGLNQAVAAARAGAAVVFHAAVGDADRDAVARSLAHEERLTLRLTGLARPTDTSIVLVRSDGENLIVSATGCAQAFDPLGAGGFRGAIGAGDILLMQGNLMPSTTRDCLAEARRRAAHTVLNPSPLWDEPLPWRDIDCLVLNTGEVQALSGEADAPRGAQVLLGRGVATVVVTRGRAGAFSCRDAEFLAVEAPSLEAVDTAGAGDVFCGVLVAHRAAGTPPGERLAQACAAASLSVTRRGALASCPTAAELASLARPPWSPMAR